ncbi:MAG TPA: hypothetical protein VIJ40_04230 [Acidimicrobiales bacterium]
MDRATLAALTTEFPKLLDGHEPMILSFRLLATTLLSETRISRCNGAVNYASGDRLGRSNARLSSETPDLRVISGEYVAKIVDSPSAQCRLVNALHSGVLEVVPVVPQFIAVIDRQSIERFVAQYWQRDIKSASLLDDVRCTPS